MEQFNINYQKYGKQHHPNIMECSLYSAMNQGIYCNNYSTFAGFSYKFLIFQVLREKIV